MKLPTKTTVNFDELFIMFSNTNRTQQQLLVQETFYALKMYIKNNGINNESSKQEVKIRDSEHGLQFLSFISSPFHEIAQEIDRGKASKFNSILELLLLLLKKSKVSIDVFIFNFSFLEKL